MSAIRRSGAATTPGFASRVPHENHNFRHEAETNALALALELRWQQTTWCQAPAHRPPRVFERGSRGCRGTDLPAARPSTKKLHACGSRFFSTQLPHARVLGKPPSFIGRCGGSDARGWAALIHDVPGAQRNRSRRHQVDLGVQATESDGQSVGSAVAPPRSLHLSRKGTEATLVP